MKVAAARQHAGYSQGTGGAGKEKKLSGFAVQKNLFQMSCGMKVPLEKSAWDQTQRSPKNELARLRRLRALDRSICDKLITGLQQFGFTCTLGNQIVEDQ